MLKLLTEQDVPDVLELGRHFHSASPYSDLEFSEDVMSEHLALCLLYPEKNICILSQTEEGVTVGALIGAIAQLPFSRDVVAHELAWWVEPDHRKGSHGKALKGAYEYWAQKMGAKKISMALLVDKNGPALRKLYQRHGYTEAETAFVKDTN